MSYVVVSADKTANLAMVAIQKITKQLDLNDKEIASIRDSLYQEYLVKHANSWYGKWFKPQSLAQYFWDNYDSFSIPDKWYDLDADNFIMRKALKQLRELHVLAQTNIIGTVYISTEHAKLLEEYSG